MNMGTGAAVFVKIDDYKDVLDVLDLIKGKVQEIRSTLESLNQLRKEEDNEMQQWYNMIGDIEKKIENIDKMMVEPEQSL